MQGTTSQRGMIPRAFEHIFEAVASDTSKKYLIRASYLEIYNENIRDLIGKDIKNTLELHVSKHKLRLKSYSFVYNMIRFREI